MLFFLPDSDCNLIVLTLVSTAPAIRFRTVVLPQPLAPKMQTISPFLTLSSTINCFLCLTKVKSTYCLSSSGATWRRTIFYLPVRLEVLTDNSLCFWLWSKRKTVDSLELRRQERRIRCILGAVAVARRLSKNLIAGLLNKVRHDKLQSDQQEKQHRLYLSNRVTTSVAHCEGNWCCALIWTRASDRNKAKEMMQRYVSAFI